MAVIYVGMGVRLDRASRNNDRHDDGGRQRPRASPGLGFVVFATIAWSLTAREKFTGGFAHSKMSRKALDALPALQADDWPSALPSEGRRANSGALDRK